MKFFTLLHVAENENSTHNNKASSFTKQIQVYVNCVKLLHKTLAHQGIELVLLTNEKAVMARLFGDFRMDIVELNFTIHVPSGTHFYSAHFKIEVFNYLGSLAEDYVALIDNDMVCINPVPASFRNCASNGIPLYYDISDQVHPVFGQEVILRDKQLVDDRNKVGIWAGGEFIAGTPQFFQQLYRQIEDRAHLYFDNIHQFHHQGDELLTSVALETGILEQHYPLLDAGDLNIVGRYWCYPTIHQQPHLDTFSNCFLLHLPSNKKLLSGLQHKALPYDRLFAFLKPRIASVYLLNAVKMNVKKLVKTKK